MSRRAFMRISRTALAVWLLLVMAPPAASGAERWIARTVTQGPSDHYGLDLSGDRLVWAEAAAVSEPFRTGGRIFTWKAGESRPTLLSAGPATFGDAPRVSGDRVAWAGAWAFIFEPGRQIDADVYTWTPSGGRAAVAAGAAQDVEVEGDRIGWRTDMDPTAHSLHPFSVSTWHPSGGVSELDRGFGGPPAVSSGRVAWWDGEFADGGAIHTWVRGMPDGTAVSGAIPAGSQLRSNYQLPVRISGDRLAWMVHGGTRDDIYTWTPSAGLVRVASDAARKSTPEVSGDRIVWAGASGARSEIYTWTPATGVVRLPSNSKANVGPQVSGERIAWAAGTAGRRQIHTWTPRTRTSRVTHGVGDNIDPVVSGDRIAWRSASRGGAYQIATATLWTPPGRRAGRAGKPRR